LYTMPEFLERRYNSTCRYLFSAFLAVGYITAIIAGSLFAGAVALENLFGWNIYAGILILGVVTGAYAIYGGLISTAWTDFLQLFILTGGGILVLVLGLSRVGGISQLMSDAPDKFQVFLPATHPLFPFTGVFTGFLSVGIWYNCTSQHIVQRCLGARDEWNARMGVVTAGFIHIVTPVLFVVPGIIAYKLFPNLERPDHAFPMLVKSILPAGLRGLILTAMAAALMSTLSSMLNSTSTLLTFDLYKRAWKPDADDKQLVRVGEWSGVLVLITGILMACYYGSLEESFVFVLIQNIFAYIAPPFAVIFTLGILWRRATGTAALATIFGGFAFTYLLQYHLFASVDFLRPYSNYLHRALLAWAFSMIVMIVVSLSTRPPSREQTEGIIWSFKYSLLPPQEQKRYSGWKDFRIWWLAFVMAVLSIYGFFLWFQFQHPIP
ncbi:MAG: sodium:solute symporter family transporter, partial [Acidobacteriota bacterium]